MAEFDEIGRTIEEFASEDATVVIGTVLDHDIQDEVRVTVVATGLNRGVSMRAAPPRVEQPKLRQVVGLRDATTGLSLDERVEAGSSSGRRHDNESKIAADLPMDYLDIPAFLRRQAD